MNRVEIINSLITKNNLKTYFEIGVQSGHCFTGVNCDFKVGVDPDKSSAATIKETSDDFFNNILPSGKYEDIKLPETFDIYFIDGLHHADQVEKDISNALNRLSKGGYIVCHDMLPTNKHMQEIPLTDQDEWTGDCWRAFLKLRIQCDDLEMYAINTDWGTSVIRYGKQELVKLTKPLSEVTYEDFEQNKLQWMNVITVDQFKNIFLK